MTIMHVAILSNPLAGKLGANTIAQLIQQKLQLKNIISHIFNIHWPDTLNGFSDVWIIGGDGTLNYFINHYPDCSIPIAVFKAGTGDDFAWKLYGDASIEEQLNIILNAAPRAVDAGKFNDQLFINCLGIGFDGEVLQSMNAIRFIGGHIGYLLIVIKKIFSFKEYAFTITADDEHWSDRFLLLMINNSTRTGGGFFISPDASINDGKLNMVLCKKLPLLKRLRYLPVIEKGKHLHLPFIINRTVQKVKIECEKELSIQVDGELRFASSLSIEILPNQFLFRY